MDDRRSRADSVIPQRSFLTSKGGAAVVIVLGGLLGVVSIWAGSVAVQVSGHREEVERCVTWISRIRTFLAALDSIDTSQSISTDRGSIAQSSEEFEAVLADIARFETNRQLSEHVNRVRQLLSVVAAGGGTNGRHARSLRLGELRQQTDQLIPHVRSKLRTLSEKLAVYWESLQLLVMAVIVLCSVVVVLLLVTRRQAKRLAAMSDRLQAELVEKDQNERALRTVAAATAHEINNPLFYVVGHLDLLDMQLQSIEDQFPDTLLRQLKDGVSQALQGADRVAQIAKDLKHIYRPAQEDLESVNLTELLQSVRNLVSVTIKSRAQMESSLAVMPPVRANESRLAQVFLNLLLNAAQAMPESRPSNENRISLRGQVEQDQVVVEITDNGMGIPPAIREKVFDPYFTTKSEQTGSGLGLYVSRTIVESYGGTLDFRSTAGEGTRFYVRLPIAAQSRTTPVPL